MMSEACQEELRRSRWPIYVTHLSTLAGPQIALHFEHHTESNHTVQCVQVMKPNLWAHVSVMKGRQERNNFLLLRGILRAGAFADPELYGALCSLRTQRFYLMKSSRTLIQVYSEMVSSSFICMEDKRNKTTKNILHLQKDMIVTIISLLGGFRNIL